MFPSWDLILVPKRELFLAGHKNQPDRPHHCKVRDTIPYTSHDPKESFDMIVLDFFIMIVR